MQLHIIRYQRLLRWSKSIVLCANSCDGVLVRQRYQRRQRRNRRYHYIRDFSIAFQLQLLQRSFRFQKTVIHGKIISRLHQFLLPVGQCFIRCARFFDHRLIIQRNRTCIRQVRELGDHRIDCDQLLPQISHIRKLLLRIYQQRVIRNERLL
ncbi:hypothetical protein D3C71_1294420 [compost metagenome]